MADQKITIELKVVDGTKPPSPKKPSTKDNIVNILILCFILAAFGILDDLLASIDSFASMF